MDALSKLDWSLVQTFLAVAESGSLSEAGRMLGISQPTAGRQIRLIEDSLNVSLFVRQPRGFALTEAGMALLPHAQMMADGMRGLSLAAAGREEELAGPVRITASMFTSEYHLPPILARLRREEPQITIDLVPSDHSENLLYREADIAVRMYRTEQLDIVTKKLGAFEVGCYATRDYLDRVGRPRRFADILTLDLIGFDRNDEILRGMRAHGVDAQRDWFVTRCDHHTVYFALLRAGCGAGFVQCGVADTIPELERIPLDVQIPPVPVYLAAHERVRNTPRLRRVWQALDDGLSPHLS